jgi:hypothetical protein
MAEAVIVGVRVRAWKDKEEESTNTVCIDMPSDVQVVVKDLTGQKEERKFSYDHAFWSFDEYHKDEDGYNHPDGKKYKDQKWVWDKLGVTLLDNAWKGKNTTIFAYGQTGAGKSYSIFGYGANKGIVPQACVEIFNRIRNNPDKNVEFQVTVMMVEIYMDRL